MTIRRLVPGLLALAILCGAGAMIWHVAQGITLAAIEQALRRTPLGSLYGSALATCVSLAGLAYYDRFATGLITPGKISNARAWMVGATSHVIANTLGFPLFTGTALRYRMYRHDGLAAADIARIVVVIGVCVALGSVTVLLIALTFARSTPTYVRAASGVAMIVLITLVCRTRLIASHLVQRGVPLPSMTAATFAAPLLAGALEGCAAIYAFYLLLPDDIRPGFATLAAVVIGAMLLGVLSHAPGGIGVFEATILATFSAGHRADVVASLLLFRLVYNLLPFTVALLCLAAAQGRRLASFSIGRRVQRH